MEFGISSIACNVLSSSTFQHPKNRVSKLEAIGIADFSCCMVVSIKSSLACYPLHESLKRTDTMLIINTNNDDDNNSNSTNYKIAFQLMMS